LLMIELEYAISDLRFGLENSGTHADRKTIQQACAQITAAQKALDVAKELIFQLAGRQQLQYAS